jgi:DNA polymerase III epsilon subunit-like protein
MDGFLLRFREDIKYCVLDVETFNLALNWNQNRIWQCGIVMAQGEKIISEHDIRIKSKWDDAPYLAIGAEAARATRFNEEIHNQTAIDYREAFEKIYPLVKDCDYILGQNILRFDLYLLRGFFEFMGAEWKFMVPKILDTKSIAQGIKTNNIYNPRKENYFEYQYKMSNSFKRGIKTSLKALCADYGFEYDENLAHDAMYDVYRTFDVWNKMKHQIEL